MESGMPLIQSSRIDEVGAMEERKFLEVENLKVEYTSEDSIIHAVNDVSFKLEKGRSLGLVGETGAGKTTIAKSIMRILPPASSHIKSGSIFLEGKDLLSLEEEEMREVRGMKISMIFQDPMTALNPVMRIGDQISEVIYIHNHISKEEAEKRAKEMLKMVGIGEERFADYPHQFSGGMKQRVVIAIALACDPELLLADEPTTALDVTIQAQVLDMMKGLREKLGTSLILITHDLGVVAEICDDVAVVYAGQIVENGSLEDIFDRPSHPYTKGLFGALPNLEEDTDRLKPIKGLPPNATLIPTGCAFAPRCPNATDECRSVPAPMKEISEGHFSRCIKV